MKIPSLEIAFESHKAVVDTEIFKKYCPRRIVCPPDYMDPKYFSLMMMHTQGLYSLKESPSSIDTVIIAVDYNLRKYGVPTYFVAKDFAKACAETEPPLDVEVSTLQLPMPGSLFVFPLNFSKQYFGYNIPFVAFSTMTNEYPSNKTDSLFGFHFPVFPEKEGLMGHYAGYFPLDCKLADVIKLDEQANFEDASLQPNPLFDVLYDSLVDGEAPKVENEPKLVSKVGMTILQILMVLNSDGGHTYVTPQIQMRKDQIKANKVIKEALWSPNFIGASYRVPQAPAGGHHAPPKMHWRRAHIHAYRVGKGKMQRKMIWIQRQLINAPE